MSKRHFLVIVDGTQEMEVALQFACVRAKATNGNIILASFIKSIDVLTTKSVSDIMKNEAREEAEIMLQKASSFVKEETGIVPTLHVREGEIIEEMLKLIEEDKNISILILASSVDKKNDPGPIISSMLSKNFARLNIPVVIVPGNISKKHISQIG